MSGLLRGVAMALGAPRVRAALGRAALRFALVVAVVILLALAAGYLLDAANTAIAGALGPGYAALVMAALLLTVAAGLWLVMRFLATRRPRPSEQTITALGNAGQILAAILGVVAAILALKPRRPDDKA
jgi:uncharacterized ion transporter superfamily protein YfcC